MRSFDDKLCKNCTCLQRKESIQYLELNFDLPSPLLGKIFILWMFLGPIFYIFRIFILKDDFYTSIRFDPRPKRGRKYGRYKAHARKHKPLCRSIMVPRQCSSREKLSPLLSPYQFLELSFMQGKLIFEAETKKIICCMNS